MFWAYIATFYLILMSISDIKHKTIVGTQRNYFMLGFTLALVGFIKRPWWYGLLVFAVIALVYVVFVRLRLLGGADVLAFGWMAYGFYIIDLITGLAFMLTFIVVLVGYELIKRVVFRVKIPLPYMPVMTLVFVITALLGGLY